MIESNLWFSHSLSTKCVDLSFEMSNDTMKSAYDSTGIPTKGFLVLVTVLDLNPSETWKVPFNVPILTILNMHMHPSLFRL